MSEATVKNPVKPTTTFISGGAVPGSALWALLASSVLLAGCYSTGGHVPDKTRFPETVPSGLLDHKKAAPGERGSSELPVSQRMAVSDVGASRLYSFRAMGQSLRVSMDQFARANNLNVIFDQDVSGIVNVEFRNLPLDQAMDAILQPIGIGWVRNDGTIRIVREVTKTYQVDYLRAARTGSTSMSSSSNSSGGSGDSGSNTISKTDSINFWTELETELKSLLAKTNDTQQAETNTMTTSAAGTVNVSSRPIQQVEGRVTINKISGTVQVTASPRYMKVVDDYMQSLMKGINRQVYIEARILDVRLNDDTALGIDWTNISFGPSLQANTSNIITSTASGATAKAATAGLNYSKTFPASFLVQSIAGAIRALEEQGTVRVVSQPKVRTLNNQPAIMKVGTDRTFYTTTTTAPIINGTTTIPGTTTETATTVTEGVLLSVTPQISADGYITLDVMPVVNKIIGTAVSPSGNSTSPIMETKQTTTLVRLKDGETAVIGGLIMEEDAETDRRVPGLGNAPVVGWAFKGKYSNKVRKELVIFITPHVIEN
ncbi:MAG: secretin and TonB N-terminal domain-containing protein [Gallionella sp.]|nr:secretin and TonB N-terminal domain-containing protein [Gallionella sp.]